VNAYEGLPYPRRGQKKRRDGKPSPYEPPSSTYGWLTWRACTSILEGYNVSGAN
jgi:hypothetical protein